MEKPRLPTKGGPPLFPPGVLQSTSTACHPSVLNAHGCKTPKSCLTMVMKQQQMVIKGIRLVASQQNVSPLGHHLPLVSDILLMVSPAQTSRGDDDGQRLGPLAMVPYFSLWPQTSVVSPAGHVIFPIAAPLESRNSYGNSWPAYHNIKCLKKIMGMGLMAIYSGFIH
jgi:hypothetical protein